MAKPTDFFLGITDLFSIILPGASMAYVFIDVEQRRHIDVLGLLRLNHTNEGYIAFFVLSYLIGHGTDLTGSMVWDELYDLTYAHWKRSIDIRPSRWAADAPGRLLQDFRNKCRFLHDSSHDFSSSATDTLFERARVLAAPTITKDDRVYQWFRARIVLQSSAAFAEVERLQATSKFFRGMVTVAVITACLSLSIQSPFHWRGTAFCAAVAFASFLRFSDLRWKAVQQTYRFYLALTETPQPPKSPDVTEAEAA